MTRGRLWTSAIACTLLLAAPEAGLEVDWEADPVSGLMREARSEARLVPGLELAAKLPGASVALTADQVGAPAPMHLIR